MPAHVTQEQFIVLGGLGIWLRGAFVHIGGRTDSAVNIGLLYGAAPVLNALASAVWLPRGPDESEADPSWTPRPCGRRRFFLRSRRDGQ